MIGNIILQKRSGIVGWIISLFTRSDYVHVGIEIENNQVVHVDFWGRHIEPISNWEDAFACGAIIVLTPKMPLSPSDKWFLQGSIIREPVSGYSLWSAVNSVLWKNPNDNKIMRKRYHCSGFVSAMYRKWLNTDLVPGLSDDATQPQDFLNSPMLRQISTNVKKETK